jgi:hypothetical protein
MLKQAEIMAKKADPALSSLLMMRINATYVVVSFLIGMDHASDLLAGKIIEAAEKIERRESSHIYFVVMPLFMVGQILAYRGDHLKVTRVVNVLKHMAENVSALIESLNQLDCTVEFNKVSMYNEVLFFNHIHRFRQSNLMYGNSWANFSESDILPSFVEEQRVPRIVELGAENPRISPHSVSSAGEQPATKRARIDHQQYQVTATAPRQMPMRASERHAEYTVQNTVHSTAEYPYYSTNVTQAEYAQQVPQNMRSNQPANATVQATRQQQAYRTSYLEQQIGGTSPPTPARNVAAQPKVGVPQAARLEQYDSRSYSEHRVVTGYIPNTVQSPVDIKYSPSISVNVTFNEVPQPRPSHYQLTPAEYYQQINNGYGAQNNVQQQQQAYYGNYEQEYNSQPYWSNQQQQTPTQPGQIVNNDANSNEYVNYR